MPRERDPKRDEAKRLWMDSGGDKDPTEIAKELGVSPGTVRGWKSKDKWERNGALQTERNAEPEQNDDLELEEDDALTSKQMLFILEYMRDFNATRSAMAVGYSKKTAYSIGWELLRKPEVQAEIRRQTDMLADNLGLDVRRIVAELMKIAFADATDYSEFGSRDVPILTKEGPLIDTDGEVLMTKENFVAIKDSSEVDGTVISEIKQGRGGSVSIKLHDKLRAIEKLERYLKYMTDEERLKMDKMKAEIKLLEEKGW